MTIYYVHQVEPLYTSVVGAEIAIDKLMHVMLDAFRTMVDTLFVFCRYFMGWVHTVWTSSICVGIMLLGYPFPRYRDRVAQFSWALMGRYWATGSLFWTGLKPRIKGKENLVGPAIFVSNHQSLIDVIVLPAIVPRTTRWVAKEELAKIPFWGWALGTSAIFVDRRNPERARETINVALNKGPHQWSIVIFPEGTRPPAHQSEMLRFKKGVFHIALQSRLPIVPIGMEGARELTPKGASLVRPGIIDVTVGRPIRTDHWRADELEQRLAEIRSAVQKCVDESRRRRGWSSERVARISHQSTPLPSLEPS